MKQLLIITLITVSYQTINAQNVGIGTSVPDYKLDVVGKIHSTSDIYVDGSVGIGTKTPIYKLQVNDGSIAISNSVDSKTWSLNYNSASNYLQLMESSTTRMVFANGGNIGINTTTPAAKLDVNGTMNATNVTVESNVTVNGNLVVDGNNGIMRNTGTSQLKYYTRSAAFTVNNLAPFGTSAEVVIGYSSAGFINAPQVMVGNILLNGGTTGQLYKMILQIYYVDKDLCKGVIINTSNSTINQQVTWNIVCIGN